MKRFLLILLAMMFCIPVMAEEESLEFVLYDSEASVPGAWQLITGVNTTNAHGDFDPYLITENGYFVVEYNGTPSAVYLALSEWTAGTWSQVDTPAECVEDGTVLKATFTYEQCVQAYGSNDFSEIDQVCVGSANSTGETRVYRIVWHGQPLQDEMGADVILFRGAATSSAANYNMAFCFTKHVGGEFDASQIGVGARIYAEYSGPSNAVYLALSSHSGATHWARVDASEVVDLGYGLYGSYFDYDAMVKAWGDNFARLDQFSVFSTTSQPITLRKLAYFAGNPEPADTSDGRWERPDTGIAFIGDSICQNAMLIYGDWNTILNRADCCNFGIGGQTTVELVARIDELANRDYSMVVFICGINDIGHGYTNEEIVGNFDQMIQTIRANNPECQFLLVSVLPTTNAFYAGQQWKIVELNAAYKKYADNNEGVHYVDVYSSFTHKEGAYAYPELLSDGLHPNADGYAKMAEVLKEYLPVE